ncbi:hypothetical protein OH491_23960 [Termitidicoccus mucosus]|uniref:Uncharacterized protein n=1 Tax=Termitidicoccus mucosus TaxID=1184151 RepID=A0A178IQD0_9BACT|nr:hypothetical protein AW736_02535 [Opitutaceae bacterium TSB47]
MARFFLSRLFWGGPRGGNRRPARRVRGGYALVEVLLAVVLSSVFMLGFMALFSAVFEAGRAPERTAAFPAPPPDGTPLAPGSGLTREEVASRWNRYERIPAAHAVRGAAVLFSDFLQLLEHADLVVVLGGTGNVQSGANGVPEPRHSDGSPQPGPGLGLFAEVAGYEWNFDNPRFLATSHGVRVWLESRGVSDFSNAGGFTVLFFRGAGDLIGATECAAQADGGFVLHAVNHWREPMVDGEFTGEGLALHSFYRCYTEGTPGGLFMGASHNWHRFDPWWQRFEEGPCRVVFPDPGYHASRVSAGVSRFVFLLDPLN